MRTHKINKALEVTLTRSRLAKYLESNNNNLNSALSAYERNTRLSEALYTPLQSLEVCLRNTIHYHMWQRFGGGWTTNGCARLSVESQQMVQDVISRLRQTKTRSSDDDIIAELRFAFWVGLLGPRYDATIWRQTLHSGFRANGPKKRSVVHGRLNAIRRFRNRVAHHEPIFNSNPVDRYNEIIEAIGWMCADTKV